MIGSYQTLSTEYRYIDADNPNDKFLLINEREQNHEYSVYHYGNYFYILTNYNAKNFRLMKTHVSKPEKNNWVEVIPHREETLLEGIDIFKNYLVIEERTNGLTHLNVKNWNNNKERERFLICR